MQDLTVGREPDYAGAAVHAWASSRRAAEVMRWTLLWPAVWLAGLS